jgi:hypothetical protein
VANFLLLPCAAAQPRSRAAAYRVAAYPGTGQPCERSVKHEGCDREKLEKLEKLALLVLSLIATPFWLC